MNDFVHVLIDTGAVTLDEAAVLQRIADALGPVDGRSFKLEETSGASLTAAWRHDPEFDPPETVGVTWDLMVRDFGDDATRTPAAARDVFDRLAAKTDWKLVLFTDDAEVVAVREAPARV